ncbi:zinc finger, C3HC4 type (RING finger) domain-containing protein [Besnoitia besnoiti]|uniref:Zinc finger, C3HC4 type (RING finger) domain-containing protein n=1 Tax=Besnoitia besnoiti TaxID=94643 RepID=A0A2A9MHE4_BESBE|nr:zinc finger, C3HC4 type (RING finger) domain-containing protein [Besnoitia besnoiti]PFH37385.1 zinc finger, C3HC4 type (RING finger) domain-containing protein [Besnoitia besnoiti]
MPSLTAGGLPSAAAPRSGAQRVEAERRASAGGAERGSCECPRDQEAERLAKKPRLDQGPLRSSPHTATGSPHSPAAAESRAPAGAAASSSSGSASLPACVVTPGPSSAAASSLEPRDVCENFESEEGMDVRFPLRALESNFRCRLCSGYFREVVTVKDCLHSFCKHCLYRRAEKGELEETCCPRCEEKLAHPNGSEARHTLVRISASAVAEAGGSLGASASSALGAGSAGNVSAGVFSSGPASGAPAATAPVLFDRAVQNLIDKLFPQFSREEALEKEELRRFLLGEPAYDLAAAEAAAASAWESDAHARAPSTSPSGPEGQRPADAPFALLGESPRGTPTNLASCPWPSSLASSPSPSAGSPAGKTETPGARPIGVSSPWGPHEGLSPRGETGASVGSWGRKGAREEERGEEGQSVVAVVEPSREEVLEELVKGTLPLFDEEETLAVALLPDQMQAVALLSHLQSLSASLPPREPRGDPEAKPQPGATGDAGRSSEEPRGGGRRDREGPAQGGMTDEVSGAGEKSVFAAIEGLRRRLEDTRLAELRRRDAAASASQAGAPASSGVPSSLWPVQLPALRQGYLRVNRRMPVMHLLRYLAVQLLALFRSTAETDGRRESGESKRGGASEAPDGNRRTVEASPSAASRSPPAAVGPVSRSLLAELESSLELTLEGSVVGRSHTLQFLCKARRLAFSGKCLLLAYQWNAQAETRRIQDALDLLKRR